MNLFGGSSHTVTVGLGDLRQAIMSLLGGRSHTVTRDQEIREPGQVSDVGPTGRNEP